MGVACCMAHSLVLLLLLSTPLHAAKSCWTVLTVQDLQLQVSWHIYLCPVACGVGWAPPGYNSWSRPVLSLGRMFNVQHSLVHFVSTSIGIDHHT